MCITWINCLKTYMALVAQWNGIQTSSTGKKIFEYGGRSQERVLSDQPVSNVMQLCKNYCNSPLATCFREKENSEVNYLRRFKSSSIMEIRPDDQSMISITGWCPYRNCFCPKATVGKAGLYKQYHKLRIAEKIKDKKRKMV